MFSNFFLKSFRILLFPLALLYGVIVIVRNWLYDRGWKKSAAFGLPLICVGNLAVGGTGKSPMVEYIAGRLRGHFRVAILSRGYKRKTKGYALAQDGSTALEIGDEPLLFHHKFPDLPVAVGEERLVAIPQLLHDRPETEAILLDDAFQHRAVQPGLNILLTDHGNLYTRDFFLPTGDLRDSRSSARRAEVIVITKCPAGLTISEAASLREEIDPTPDQQLFFTTIDYGSSYHILSRATAVLEPGIEVLLVTGIANPKPLKSYLEEQVGSYSMMHFGDHHIFNIDDWREIRKRYDEMDGDRKLILTTEKDAMRLLKFENELSQLPFYVVPIEHRFLFDGAAAFDGIVTNFIKEFKTRN